MTFVVKPAVNIEASPSAVSAAQAHALTIGTRGLVTVMSLTEVSAPSLNLQVGTGKCVINGYYVEISAAETIAMNTSETAKVYIQLTRNGNSEVTGAQLGKTTGALPADSYQVAEVVTDGTEITTITRKQYVQENADIVLLKEASLDVDLDDATYGKMMLQAGDSNNKNIVTRMRRNGSIGDMKLWGTDPGSGLAYLAGNKVVLGSGDTKPSNVAVGTIAVERDTGNVFVHTGSGTYVKVSDGEPLLGSHTLGSAATTLTASSLPAKKKLRIIIVCDSGGSAPSLSLRFNNDSGSNYAYRRSVNGAAFADTTSAAQIALGDGATAGVWLLIIDVINMASLQHGVIAQSVTGGGAASAVPITIHAYGKHASTTQITRVDLISSVNLSAGSALLVFGHD